MRYTEIRFSKKVSQSSKPSLGQYESEELALTATMSEDEEVKVAVTSLIGEVSNALGVKGPQVSTAKVVVASSESVEKPVVTKEAAISKKAAAVEQAPSTATEAAVSETQPKEEVAKTVAPSTETKAETPKERATRTRTVKKVKAVPYDRTLDAHKKAMGEVCAKLFGTDWRLKPAVLAKVKDASPKAVGLDFIGEDGEVVASFIEKFKELTA